MRDLRNFMDSTYLKTAEQAGCSEEENKAKVEALVKEAIEEKFKLAMIRPEYVCFARRLVDESQSGVLVGTVIDFPNGAGGLEAKLQEAARAMEDGADELDFVVDYQAFKRGEVAKVREEIERCTLLGLAQHKVVKWIIEIAALSDMEVVQLTSLVKKVVLSKCHEKEYDKVFVKSSTGFYQTKDGSPNGATLHGIVLMLENAGPLPVKAAGGVRTKEEALEMINLGVRRLGTSSAKHIVDDKQVSDNY